MLLLVVSVREARDAVVSGVATQETAVEGEPASCAVEDDLTVPLVGDAPVESLHETRERPGRQLEGNAAVDHVDDPADRGPTVNQRGRTTKDLDPQRRGRLDGDRVIGAGCRGISTAEPPLQDADSIAT